MLQRIYARACFLTQRSSMSSIEAARGGGKARDHRSSGRELDLFVFIPGPRSLPVLSRRAPMVYNGLLRASG